MAGANKGPAAVVDGAKRFVTGFRGFSTGQKAVVVAVIAALVAGAVLFSRWASTPTYAPLFSSLSSTDASAIVDKLKADGTPYQLTDGGASILVPTDVVYDTRLEMSGAGLPAASDSGNSLLMQQGVTSSEFVMQKAYQQDLSHELEKTIEAVKGVDTAVVNLAIPQKDVFLDEQDATTASVLVKLKPGASLSTDQVTSIVNLVAGGVEGMDPKNVSVVDDKGNTLSTDGTGSTAQQEKTSDFNAAASSSLQAYLESIYGVGNVTAKVTATLDFDDRKSTATTYSYPKTLPALAGTTSTESYGGAAGNAATGVLGPDNIQVPSGTSTSGNYSKSSTTNNNPIDRTDTTTISAPGAVRKQTVSVVIDAKKAGAADVNQVTQIVDQAAGIDAARGDSVSVVKTTFDNSAATAAADQLKQAAAAEKQQSLIDYAKTGGLALLVLIMLIVVLVSFRRRKVEHVDSLDVNAPPISLGDITGELAEPRMLESVPQQRIALEPAPVDPTLEAAAARRDEVVELVSRQPDEVAELLRGWLADRRS